MAFNESMENRVWLFAVWTIIFIINKKKKKITWFWLAESSAVQVYQQCKKCNTGAKSVTPVQITKIVILDYDWLKDKRKFSKTMISRKMMTKKFVQKLRMRKQMASRKTFGLFLSWELPSHAISGFLKNSLVQINSKLISKQYDYLY